MDILASSSIQVAGDSSRSPAVVQLSRMRQQTEVRDQEDDWTGRTDAAERRRLQNRLNQRIYRKRRQAPQKSAELDFDSGGPIVLPPLKAQISCKFTGLTAAVNEVLETHNEYESPESVRSGHSNLTMEQASTEVLTGRRSQWMGRKQLENMMAKFEMVAARDYNLGSPRIDQLLTLIQFNVFRALMNNTATLDWTLEWLECSDPISPWNVVSFDSKLSCPRALRPSALQLTVEHHPWIDLWPIPMMRDNLLLAGDMYDEDQLCNDLVEFGGNSNEHTGLICWGESWDPASWEVSEAFIRNWEWTMKGCAELLVSTNYWRTRRGEQHLIYEV